MNAFSGDSNDVENIGKLVLETLLSSNIDSITDINLRTNPSWFKEEERQGNVDLLMELITKQTGLQKIELRGNAFSDAAKQKIETRISSHPNTSLESYI